MLFNQAGLQLQKLISLLEQFLVSLKNNTLGKETWITVTCRWNQLLSAAAPTLPGQLIQSETFLNKRRFSNLRFPWACRMLQDTWTHWTAMCFWKEASAAWITITVLNGDHSLKEEEECKEITAWRMKPTWREIWKLNIHPDLICCSVAWGSSVHRTSCVQFVDPADRLTRAETDGGSTSGEASVGSADKNKQGNKMEYGL